MIFKKAQSILYNIIKYDIIFNQNLFIMLLYNIVRKFSDSLI